ncbi:MAG: ParB/RepB/Spo0J family partition protein [Roseobacter sp.]
MSKRRVFDIDFEATQTDPVPAGTEAPEARRGPMAAAISENADALSARAAAEAQIRAENDKLAHEYVALRKNGQIVGRIPLSEIKASKLIRDRKATRDPELAELKASIRDVGLSNPIHVEEVAGGYELIQGFRRLSAYRELLAETGDDTYATIPANLQAKGDALEALYRRMVDENLVRRDISFAEMAQLALSYAERTGENVDLCVDKLFASAGRQKRSYIRHFGTLLAALGDDLKCPETVPRAMGLSLVKLLEANPRFGAQVRAVLNSHPDRDAATELCLLRGAVSGGVARPAKPKPAPVKSSAKTTIRMNRPEGGAKCTASGNRFEVALDYDVGAVDPRRLEVALRAFLNRLTD